MHWLLILLPALTGAQVFSSNSKPASAKVRQVFDDGFGGKNATYIKVASLRFQFVAVPLMLTAFIMIIVCVKLVFEHMHVVAEAVPESCLLILLGLVLGGLLSLDKSETFHLLEFNPDTFFLYLLPPIILDAAYSLRDRAFAENFGTIILYAVVGTLLNWILIALGLWGLEVSGAMFGFHPTILDCFIFAALISAVDPVAVLAIFQELGVNKMLYFMVFGESLLNDAVTVVLYTLLVTFTHMRQVEITDVGMGCVAFAVSSGGAILIGTIFGFATGYVTKFTHEIRVVEPTCMFGMAYLAYLFAELFHFSGIISLICCGLLQSHYAMRNISSKSYVTVHYFSKVMSSVTESLIFIILGVMLVNGDFWATGWSTAFSIYSLVLVCFVRTLIVFVLTYMVNKTLKGIRRISISEQCIMAYGGLRGAISFSLVFMLSDRESEHRDTLMCATFVVILFTVFVQGATIKPLVHYLEIRLEKTGQVTMWDEVNRNTFTQGLSKRFVRPVLHRSHETGKGNKLLDAYAEMELQAHLASYGAGGTKSGDILDQLDLVDDMLDAKDAARSLKQRKDKADEAERKISVYNLHKMMIPLHLQVHYQAGDKNLRRGTSVATQMALHHIIQEREQHPVLPVPKGEGRIGDEENEEDDAPLLGTRVCEMEMQP